MLRRIDWSTPRQHPGKDHPLRGGARNPRLGRSAPPHRSRRPALLRLLPPALVDEPLIFVEVALTEAIPGAIAPLLAEDRPPVRDRARPHRRVLFDLQYPARPRRHFVRQFFDQAGGRGIAARIAAAGEVRHAVAGAGLDAVAEGGGRRSALRRRPRAARSSRRRRTGSRTPNWQRRCVPCSSRSPPIIS